MKFKIGDIIVGNSSARYGITRAGWSGKVISCNSEINIIRVVELGSDRVFDVDPKYFDLSEEDLESKCISFW